MLKIVCLINARGGSKGIPRKNIKPLNGKPLLSYVVEQAKKLPYPIYVSTEDSEIKKVALSLGVEVVDRPLHLAQDDSTSLDAVLHAQQFLNADWIVLLNACTPFVDSEDIKACVDIATKEKPDSVVSLVEDFSSHPSKVCYLFGNDIVPVLDNFPFITSTRQTQGHIFKRNTAIYVISKKNLENNTLLGHNVLGYVMPKSRSLDLNDEFDWKLAESLWK